MNCICKFLYDILPTDADKVQAWAAIGGLCLTGIMTYYARQALNTWRNQEDHKFYLEAFEVLEEAVLFVNDIYRRSNLLLLTEEEKHKFLGINNKNLKETYRDVKSLKSFLSLKEGMILKVQTVSNKSIALLSPSNPIRVFYTKLGDKVSSFRHNIGIVEFPLEVLIKEDLIIQGKIPDQQNVSNEIREQAINTSITTTRYYVDSFYKETITDDDILAIKQYRENYVGKKS